MANPYDVAAANTSFPSEASYSSDLVPSLRELAIQALPAAAYVEVMSSPSHASIFHEEEYELETFEAGSIWLAGRCRSVKVHSGACYGNRAYENTSCCLKVVCCVYFSQLYDYFAYAKSRDEANLAWDTIKHSTELQALNFSSARLSSLRLVEGFSHIRHLNISNARLSSFEGIETLQNLEELTVTNVRGPYQAGSATLTEPDWSQLGALYTLKKIQAKVTELFRYLPSLTGLTRLEELDLSLSTSFYVYQYSTGQVSHEGLVRRVRRHIVRERYIDPGIIDLNDLRGFHALTRVCLERTKVIDSAPEAGELNIQLGPDEPNWATAEEYQTMLSRNGQIILSDNLRADD